MKPNNSENRQVLIFIFTKNRENLNPFCIRKLTERNSQQRRKIEKNCVLLYGVQCPSGYCKFQKIVALSVLDFTLHIFIIQGALHENQFLRT